MAKTKIQKMGAKGLSRPQMARTLGGNGHGFSAGTSAAPLGGPKAGGRKRGSAPGGVLG
ncbi:MAG: hypothetical protein HYY16_04650 [Planctomycetes bacterium]|nr:hypothetical protein [Planctomycetota bacterium]